MPGKLQSRSKSDLLKAKYLGGRAKTGSKGRKREESGVFASWPPHHFVNKFHNNGLLSGGWIALHIKAKGGFVKLGLFAYTGSQTSPQFLKREAPISTSH